MCFHKFVELRMQGRTNNNKCLEYFIELYKTIFVFTRTNCIDFLN